jgi:hypothetical protein
VATRVRRLDAARMAELARLLPELGPSQPVMLPPDEQRRRLFDAPVGVRGTSRRPDACWPFIEDLIRWRVER